MVSHYGKEHFCPISLFHVYGNSEYEVLDNEEDSRSGSTSNRQEEDSTEEEMLFDLQKNNTSNTDVVVEGRNLFGSAKEAVINIVKKAAEVLTKSPAPHNVMAAINETAKIEKVHPAICYTAVEPVNVSRAINGSLSCEWKQLKFLATLPWLHSSLLLQCQRESSDQAFSSVELAFAKSIWNPSTIQALCHWILPEDSHTPSSSESVLPIIAEFDVPENVNPFTEAPQVGEVESINAEQSSSEQTELEHLEQLFSEEMGTVATSSDDIHPIGMEANIPSDGFLIEPSKPISVQQQQQQGQQQLYEQQQQEQHQHQEHQIQQQQQQQHRQQQTQKESVFVRLSNRYSTVVKK